MVCIEQKYDASKADELCAAIKKYMVEAAKTKSEKEKVKDVTVQNLINWGVIKNVDGTLFIGLLNLLIKWSLEIPFINKNNSLRSFE